MADSLSPRLGSVPLPGAWDANSSQVQHRTDIQAEDSAAGGLDCRIPWEGWYPTMSSTSCGYCLCDREIIPCLKDTSRYVQFSQNGNAMEGSNQTIRTIVIDLYILENGYPPHGYKSLKKLVLNIIKIHSI